MKKITLFFCLLLSGLSSNAALKEKGYLIKTDFSLKNKSKKIELASELILDGNNKNWITLIPFDKGFLVLGKIKKADKKKVYMEYIVVDGSRKPNNVISTPAIIGRFNEEAKISISGDEEISLTLKATPTEYEVKD